MTTKHPSGDHFVNDDFFIIFHRIKTNKLNSIQLINVR